MIYHIGVIFLPVRNAADVVTSRLANLAEHDRLLYLALTLALGVAITLGLLLFGHRDKLRWQSFAVVALEGVIYAMLMRLVAGLAVAELQRRGLMSALPSNCGLSPGMLDAGALLKEGAFSSFIMAVGAGFYEELAFRAIGFGAGRKLLLMLDDWSPWVVSLLWGAVISVAFSAWHHIGPMGEPFTLNAFVFRTLCGAAFTTIYAFRGFAPAVWTHAIYDVWVMVF